eukprot:482641-Amphidinium_carterae.1
MSQDMKRVRDGCFRLFRKTTSGLQPFADVFSKDRDEAVLSVGGVQNLLYLSHSSGSQNHQRCQHLT